MFKIPKNLLKEIWYGLNKKDKVKEYYTLLT